MDDPFLFSVAAVLVSSWVCCLNFAPSVLSISVRAVLASYNFDIVIFRVIELASFCIAIR